jgi:hypothetical protein
VRTARSNRLCRGRKRLKRRRTRLSPLHRCIKRLQRLELAPGTQRRPGRYFKSECRPTSSAEPFSFPQKSSLFAGIVLLSSAGGRRCRWSSRIVAYRLHVEAQASALFPPFLPFSLFFLPFPFFRYLSSAPQPLSSYFRLPHHASDLLSSSPPRLPPSFGFPHSRFQPSPHLPR